MSSSSKSSVAKQSMQIFSAVAAYWFVSISMVFLNKHLLSGERLDAPLFVWYEVAFACGYDPALKQQLDDAVAARHAAWDL